MSGVITRTGQTVQYDLIKNYFHDLVNRFFKILPMRENGEDSLPTYMRSLSIELIGGQDLIPGLNVNPSYLTLLSILEYLINTPDCEISDVRREIFHAISVCNKLEVYFSTEV